ncbi:MAG: hypothetical protein QOJ40_157, partial [Verrucomicrobiota bacterium]
EIWVRFNTTFDTLGALRLSCPLIAAPFLLLFWLGRRELPWPRVEGSVSAKLFRQQLGGPFFWLCGAATIALCALSIGLPLFQLASVKRTWTELPGALAAGQLALWNSFSLAAAAATTVVVLSLAIAQACHDNWKRYPGRLPNQTAETLRFQRNKAATEPREAFGVRRIPALFFRTRETALDHAKPKRRNAAHSKRFATWVGGTFNSLLWLPFLLPGVLLGIGLIAAFNRPVLSLFYQSAGIVVLAFVIRYLALGWNAVGHAFRTVDPDLTDVARLNGATRWQMLRHVYWPQIKPQVAGAWYVVFLLCLWDVESMILVVPPGGETLALRVFNLLHYGHNAQVNALCLTLLALAVAPLFIWQAYRMARSVWQRNRLQVEGCRLEVSCLLSVSAILLLAGCAPKSASNDAPLQSQLFSRVQIIGTRGVGVGQLNKPRSVAVDRQDNLYVADMTGRVQKFSSNGLFLLSWQMPQTDKGKPKGMCRDREGNIVVLEPHYQRVNHFSAEGKLIAQWGEHGTNAGQFTLPRAVAVNSRGEMFVSEYEGVERVQRFSLGQSARAPTFHLLNGFGHAGNGPGEFNRPEGLCVDAQDRVYVADSCNHRIEIFSSDGKFIRAYGKAGAAKGELSYPYDICVDRAGRQYVCEFGNSRVQVFDANDQPIEIIGGPGAQPGQFSNPWGVALDSAEDLYVADSQNHRVQKFIRK